MKSSYRINEKRMEHAVKIPLKIIDKVKPSICKIIYKNNKGSGTGFFIQLNDYKCIMTNYHIISTDLINQIIYIKLFNNKKIQLILKEKFIKFFNNLDITIIELDNIKNINNYIKDVYFLDYDSNYNKGYEQYLDIDIFTLQYPREDIEVAIGKLKQILNEFEFKHNIDTDYGSSGSPIILVNTLKVIGIHKQGSVIEDVNYGTFIGEIFKYNKFKKLNNYININNNVMKNNNNINKGSGIPNNNNMMNNNMNFGMMGIPNNNMMINNNFDMGNNMMMNNINNNNFGMPGLGNIQIMNPINNWQNMMNNNEIDNNSYFDDRNKPEPIKKNIIFKYSDIYTPMIFNYDTTVDEMLKKYLKRTNRADLYGKNNKIEFKFNGNNIEYGDKTPIGELFKYFSNAIVDVIEKQYLLGSSPNMKLIKTESIVHNEK